MTTEDLVEMNGRLANHDDIGAIAADWLTAHKLIRPLIHINRFDSSHDAMGPGKARPEPTSLSASQPSRWRTGDIGPRAHWMRWAAKSIADSRYRPRRSHLWAPTGWAILFGQAGPDEVSRAQLICSGATPSGVGARMIKSAVPRDHGNNDQSAAQGASGVGPELVVTMAEMLNRGVTPWSPGGGSVGYLIATAHIGLAVFGQGKAWYENGIVACADPCTGGIALRQPGRGRPCTARGPTRSPASALCTS